MNKPNCPACDSTFCLPAPHSYWHCFGCGTIFVPGGLPQEGMVGGTFEVERSQQNPKRAERIAQCLPDGGRVLDFGCGNGLLVDALTQSGFSAHGYDKFSQEFGTLPDGPFDAVTLVEVIEHLGKPSGELALISMLLKQGGFLMVESTFRHDESVSEVLGWEYANPSIGHCTILSVKGLDRLMQRSGLELFNGINRNVRIYRKV